MRPLKLTLSAFGPYSDKTVIDMEKLGTSGLYLITGDTGAGKTTVFDGIIYALYGQPSGNNREVAMLRSKYAKAETPTYVELIFDYKGKTYTVIRNPEYERPAKRGGGITKEKASVTLTMPNGSILTKPKEADAKLYEIMGIDKNQFCQIAMIAQGDFLKLITASTEERKNILRKIFRTEPYRLLQENLKIKASEIQNKYNELSISISQYISGIILPDDMKKSGEIISSKEITKQLNEIIISDIEKEKTLSEIISKKETEINICTEKLTQAENNEQLKSKLKTTEIKLNEEYINLKKLKDIAQYEKSRQNLIEQNKKYISIIESELPLYLELDEKNIRLENLNFQNQTDTKTLYEKTQHSTKSENLIKSMENELKTLEKSGVNLAFLENKKEKLSEKLNALNQLVLDKNKLIKLKQDYIKVKNDYLTAYKNYTEKSAVYEHLNMLYLNEQAGILAETLFDNKPCPVCGSVNHPKPAKKSQNAPTEEKLKLSKSEMEKAHNDATEKSSDASHKKGTYNANLETFKLNCQKILGEYSAENISDIISEQISLTNSEIYDLDIEIQIEEINSQNKIKLEKTIPKEKEFSEKLKNEINILSQKLAAEKSDIENLKENIINIEKKVKFKNKSQALYEKNKLTLENQSMEKAFENAINNVNSCENQISLLNGQTEQLKSQLNVNDNTDIENLKETQILLKEEKSKLLTEKENIHVRLTSNEKTAENLKLKFKDYEETAHYLTIIKDLYNTASGNISGKEKIMLETYIQTAYFDRIIARANIRFLIMSGNQYELKRSVDTDNHKSQSGLDLNVIDHYNGSERSVKSLSGGESFKASLSLALGLADEIQSSAGGIQLDTMFVDEGFGSLDENSLQQAVKALCDLSQSNKLVGIISHIPELKDKIDKQIIIKKNQNGGSNVKILV